MESQQSTYPDIRLKKTSGPTTAGPARILSTGGNGGIHKIIIRSVAGIFNRRQQLHAQFFAITKKLSKFFSISGAVLIVHSQKDDCLKAIALKGENYSREGLAISLPRTMSLLYDIFSTNEQYIENYPDGFPGNFVERKLILGEDTRSIMICPTRCEGEPNGLICFASPVPYAFVLLGNGNFNEISEKIGAVINRTRVRLNI